jgi:hypothetical protein
MRMGKALRISWQEKLADSKDLPKVVEINDRMSQRWGMGTCVIPAPKEVDELMRKVPRGNLTTFNEIRAALARRHGATIGCPITPASLPASRLAARKRSRRARKTSHHTGGR